MPRGLSAALLTEIQKRAVSIAYFYKGEFSTTTLRLWTGAGTLNHDSQEWLGNGWLLSVGESRSSLNTQADGVRLTLSGVPANLLSIALNESNEGGTGTIWLAFLDDTDSVIGTTEHFRGDLDTIDINEDPERPTITINYESRLIRLLNSREIRYSNAMQQNKYSGDRGFEYLTFLEQQRIYWGRPDTTRGR